MFRSTVALSFLALSTLACQTLLGIDDTTESAGSDGGMSGDGGVSASCGDNTLDVGETCDDGNRVSGDGCSAVCFDEAAFCSPTLVGSFNTSGGENVGRMIVDGSFLYMATGINGGFPTLRIYNLSDLDAIVEEGRFNMTPQGDYPNHETVGIAKNGDFIWLSGENPEFISVDVSTPATPTLRHQAGPNESGGHSSLIGDILYIAYPVSETARAFNVAGGDAISLASNIGDRNNVYYNIAAAGTHAYVSNGSNVVDVVDMSDVANPTVVGKYTHSSNWGSLTAVERMVASDTLLALAVPFGSGARGVHLIDVSLKTAPSFAGTIESSNNDSPRDLALRGDFLYIAVSSGLRVYDVSNPDSLRVAASFVELQSFSASVAVDGNLAYLGTESGVRVISGLPGLCDAICGNSTVEYPEDCDDGNRDDGDGCAANCLSQ